MHGDSRRGPLGKSRAPIQSCVQPCGFAIEALSPWQLLLYVVHLQINPSIAGEPAFAGLLSHACQQQRRFDNREEVTP